MRRKQRPPLVKVQGKVYRADDYANYVNQMNFAERYYRAQALMQYFEALRQAQQRQK